MLSFDFITVFIGGAVYGNHRDFAIRPHLVQTGTYEFFSTGTRTVAVVKYQGACILDVGLGELSVGLLITPPL